MKTRVVGVHGVANFRPGQNRREAGRQLAVAWQRAIGRGPLDLSGTEIDLSVAYYADHLRIPGAQGANIDLDRLDPDARQMMVDWLTAIGAPEGLRQGAATYPLRQALSWIAQRRGLAPHLVERFVAIFFAEVSRYVRPAPNDARISARATVRDTILEHGPRIVIAHSLGSVVTYEALWDEPPPQVDLLITLGSPLALPRVVFPRLMPAPVDDRGRRPPGVRRWVNIADPGDLIAIPVRGVSRQFVDVDVDEHGAIHAFDFHLAANYLASPHLARILSQHLTPSTDSTP